MWRLEDVAFWYALHLYGLSQIGIEQRRLERWTYGIGDVFLSLRMIPLRLGLVLYDLYEL